MHDKDLNVLYIYLLLLFTLSKYDRVTWQLKEKRRQLFLKTTSEGRQRAKQKRYEVELERERRNQLDEERRMYTPMSSNLHNFSL